MKYLNILAILVGCILLVGCKKYLAKKPDQKLVVPQTLQDLQALLDDHSRINTNHPGAGEASAGDFYLLYNNWASRTEFVRRMYVWEKEKLFAPGNNNDWVNAYVKVYIANTVLDNISSIKTNLVEVNALNNTKGSALFLRGICFTQLAWIFCLAYDHPTANADLGLPLRLSSDFNKPSRRDNLSQTYQQILSDLKQAALLLPASPLHVLRPSKPAAWGWLARVYLSMRNYDSALVYSDRYLQSLNSLVDFNSLSETSASPVPSYNVEVAWQNILTRPVSSPMDKVDSLLYASYDSNDLRKTIYFFQTAPGQYSFKGSFDGSNGSSRWFNGITTGEMYLIRAECYARLQMVEHAMHDLNTLMLKRWRNTAPFIPYTAGDPQAALHLVLTERRKELYARGLRWADIKRLNKEGASIVLRRVLNGEVFELPPNDLRYALPIPEDVIAQTGMQQNPG